LDVSPSKSCNSSSRGEYGFPFYSSILETGLLSEKDAIPGTETTLAEKYEHLVSMRVYRWKVKLPTIFLGRQKHISLRNWQNAL
jgi:hypothetical protein